MALKILKSKDLLGLEQITKDEIELIFKHAEIFKEVLKRPIPKVPTLRGKTVCNLFFEPSTRTRSSFELAEKRLSTDILNFSASSSALSKGESILDTLKNIEVMKIDAFVIRDANSGTPYFLAKRTSAPVINAGDGTHEHPTQGLLDMFTMREKFNTLRGLKVLIIGDILHSRVARSNIFGLLKMGSKVFLCGPPTLLPPEFKSYGCEIFYNINEILPYADVVMALRIQKERGGVSLIPSLREYRLLYGITRDRIKLLKKGACIMHPGPVNWGVELDYEVQELKENLILEQVENGIAIRMAVLYLLLSPQEKI